MKALLVFFLMSLAALPAQAATHYVRAGATDAQNGSDWTSAYSALPRTLVRGDTYYIASGSYPSYAFNDAQSGTLTITVKKATPCSFCAGAGLGRILLNAADDQTP